MIQTLYVKLGPFTKSFLQSKKNNYNDLKYYCVEPSDDFRNELDKENLGVEK